MTTHGQFGQRRAQTKLICVLAEAGASPIYLMNLRNSNANAALSLQLPSHLKIKAASHAASQIFLFFHASRPFMKDTKIMQEKWIKPQMKWKIDMEMQSIDTRASIQHRLALYQLSYIPIHMYLH